MSPPQPLIDSARYSRAPAADGNGTAVRTVINEPHAFEVDTGGQVLGRATAMDFRRIVQAGGLPHGAELGSAGRQLL